jgi:hypothetical protein
MRTREYITESARTAIEMGRTMDMLHCALGLATEALEVLEAEDAARSNHYRGGTIARVTEEYGDLAWYAALGYRTLSGGEDVEEVDTSGMCERLTGHLVEHCASEIKAHVYYGRPLDEPAMRAALYAIVDRVGCETRAANIRKLCARYPERFDIERANDRDTASELDAVRGE